MDASAITQRHRLTAIARGDGVSKGVSSGGYSAGMNSLGRTLSVFSVSKSNKSKPISPPSITFVSYSSPNATLAYTSGTETVSEYGFMVGDAKYPITDKTNVLKLTDYLFPTWPSIFEIFSVHAYLTYGSTTIMSTAIKVRLQITFGTFSIDANGVAHGNYGGDYLPKEVGIMDMTTNYYYSITVSESFSVDVFSLYGQITTNICPYVVVNDAYYTSADCPLYDWNNYLTFSSTTFEANGDIRINYNCSINGYSFNGVELRDSGNNLITSISSNIVSLQNMADAQSSMNTYNTYNSIININGNWFIGQSFNYFWKDYITLNLSAESNGTLTFSATPDVGFTFDISYGYYGSSSSITSPYNMFSHITSNEFNASSGAFDITLTASYNNVTIFTGMSYDILQIINIGFTESPSFDVIEVAYTTGIPNLTCGFFTATKTSFDCTGTRCIPNSVWQAPYFDASAGDEIYVGFMLENVIVYSMGTRIYLP